MKTILLTAILAASCLFATAQSYEGTVEYLKKDQKAMVLEFPLAPSIVEDAIVQKMEKLGYKKKTSKGFLVYKNAILSDISSEPADYMIRVERKSRKEKDESVVYLIMNRGEENIIARTDALINSNIKSFMNNMAPDVEAHNLELEIKAQEKLVEKAEKKFRDLVKDKEDMEKKIKDLEDDIRKNTKDQEEQQKLIETQNEVLEAMRRKRAV